MKRTGVYLLVMALFLSACIPALPSLQQPDGAPAVDVQATDAALALTLAVETLNALPTPTLEPATDTPVPTATFTETATAAGTATSTNTLTPDPNASATNTLTPNPNVTSTATGTSVTATVTVTGILPTTTPFTPTATETLHARFYGTLPPAIPYGKVSLINRAKAEVYISMHCTTVDGYTTIIEYPVAKGMRVSAPAGKYTYVAWVGGRQFQGSFSLGKNNEVAITFMKDKVIVKK